MKNYSSYYNIVYLYHQCPYLLIIIAISQYRYRRYGYLPIFFLPTGYLLLTHNTSLVYSCLARRAGVLISVKLRLKPLKPQDLGD